MLNQDLKDRILRQAEFCLNYEMEGIIRDHKLQREPVVTAGRMSLEVVEPARVDGVMQLNMKVRVMFKADLLRVLTIADVSVPKLARVHTIDEALAPQLIDFAARLMDGLFAS